MSSHSDDMELTNVHVNCVNLVREPHLELARISLRLMEERENLIDSLRGKRLSEGGGGKIVDMSYRGIVVEGDDKSRREVAYPNTSKMRQLLAGTTTRK